MIALLLQN